MSLFDDPRLTSAANSLQTGVFNPQNSNAVDWARIQSDAIRQAGATIKKEPTIVPGNITIEPASNGYLIRLKGTAGSHDKVYVCEDIRNIGDVIQKIYVEERITR